MRLKHTHIEAVSKNMFNKCTYRILPYMAYDREAYRRPEENK